MKKKTDSGNHRGIIAVLVIGVIVAVLVIGFAVITTIQQPNPPTATDPIPPPTDISPEIQEKLDKVQKTNDENSYSPKDREWITSGPFQIDRSQYILGEKIFLRVGGLATDDIGKIFFLKPQNQTHYSVYLSLPFDGSAKSTLNYYLNPGLSKTRGVCTVDDLVGDWRVVFKGTDYPNLEFEIINQILPGDEDSFKPVC